MNTDHLAAPVTAPDDVRALGALTTRLQTALAQAREALAPHAGLLAPDTLGTLDTLLADLARRRIRIALYGEVKAGKSTLLNAIAGAPLSPVAFDPLTAVPVRVTYGEETVWRIGERRLESLEALEAFMRKTADAVGTDPALLQTDEVVVETDLDLLELGGQVDLVDTPGVGSAAAFDAISADALRALDAVVLVVRYPALFTQFTRHLMDGLQGEIGKLFVVWNLDADCAELSAEERERHAATLRTNVAGAHELFLVDARRAFRAMVAEDGAGSIASGISGFITALRRYAASGHREVSALRQAAKRAKQQLSDAHRRVSQRHAALTTALADARARLDAARTAADTASAQERGRSAALEAALANIAQATTADAEHLAEDCRRALRRARSAWVRRGDYAALTAAIAAAVAAYADAVASRAQGALQALAREAQQYGTAAALQARPRTEPPLAELADADRMTRATTGHLPLLRRAVWHRWYVPGLAQLDAAAIPADLQTQAAWIAAAVHSVSDAARTTLEARLDDIARRADAEQAQIRADTDFDANEAEHAQLTDHVPRVAAQVDALRAVTADARTLL